MQKTTLKKADTDTKEYQIRFLDNNRNGYFKYFRLPSNATQAEVYSEAKEIANQDVRERFERIQQMMPFCTPDMHVKIVKKIDVVEYANGRTVRNGIKLKLRLVKAHADIVSVVYQYV